MIWDVVWKCKAFCLVTPRHSHHGLGTMATCERHLSDNAAACFILFFFTCFFLADWILRWCSKKHARLKWMFRASNTPRLIVWHLSVAFRHHRPPWLHIPSCPELDTVNPQAPAQPRLGHDVTLLVLPVEIELILVAVEEILFLFFFCFLPCSWCDACCSFQMHCNGLAAVFYLYL